MLHPNSTKVWDKDMKSGKLKKRLYKGVPDAVRGEVWSRLLHIKKTKEEQIGKYEVIVSCLLSACPLNVSLSLTHRTNIVWCLFSVFYLKLCSYLVIIKFILILKLLYDFPKKHRKCAN